ncbi:MAG: glycoside hydrolase family 43 protein [Candidatus Fimenecus sp.]
MKRFRKSVAGLMATVLFLLCVSGCSAPKTQAVQKTLAGDAQSFDDSNGVSVHDPSLFRAQDGTYYVTGSHIASAKSADLIHWSTVSSGVFDSNSTLVFEGETLRGAYAKAFAWCDGAQNLWERTDEEWETNVWASDIIYNEAMGKYCYYACTSVWGTTASVIWFATADSPEGTFTFADTVVYSGFNKRERFGKPRNEMHYSFTNLGTLIENGVFTEDEIENAPWYNENGDYDCTYGKYPNAIDPAPFYDAAGNLWLVYGSFSGGIYVMPLVEETGLPDYAAMKTATGYDMYFGKQITCTNEQTAGTGEGPFITYDAESGYYYLFLSYGALGALDGYNIREYRSETPDGVYVDAAGKDAREMQNTGTPILGNYQFSTDAIAFLSGGHSSCLVDTDGRIFQAYHQRYADGEGAFHNVQIHQMLRTNNGWLTMLPLMYNGETATAVSLSALTGEYETVIFTPEIKTATDWNGVQEIIRPTETMKIAADGTVTVGGKTGTLQLDSGAYTFTLTVDGATYHGACCVGTQNGAQKMTISALSDNNQTLWAVAK